MAAITDHPAFKQPPHIQSKIWRYMDFAKFVALLQAGSLYFPRLELLGDPFEGTLSKDEFDHWREVAARGEQEGNLPHDWSGQYFDILMLNARTARRSTYVNCWHLNDVESEAMWRLYSASGYAIAIQSTYERLTSLLPEECKNGCYVGLVNYTLHDKEKMPDGNIFYPIMHKRRSFEHEREVRAVIWYRDPGTNQPELLDTYPTGINIPIDLNTLIEQVVVSPIAPEWFADTVVEICKKYQLTAPVIQSDQTIQPYI